MALWRRSSAGTVRVVLFLCAAAAASSVIYIRHQRRSAEPAGGASAAPEVKLPSALVVQDARPAKAVVTPPAVRDDVKLTARTPLGQEDVPAEIRDARSALSRGDALTARRMFSAALKRELPDDTATMVRGELTRLADSAIFSPDVLAEDGLVTLYPVAKGDTLVTIAKRFKITDQLIVTLNGLTNRDRLKIGTPLKVVRGPFRAVVSKSKFRIDLLLGDVLVRSMSVGLGTNGSTPTGRWRVRDKLSNPGWTDPRTNEFYHPDAVDNPIGEYWIGLEGLSGEAVGKRGFGIHGTIDPGSIGRQMSLGCVRLLPADIETVYRLLIIGDSTVEIVE